MAKNEKKTKKDNKHFLKDFKAEIKKVIWPTSKQLINTTVAIIAMVIVVSVIVFGLDLAFDAMNKYGLTKLQETVQNIDSNEEIDDNSEEVEEDAETSEDEIVVEDTDSTDQASTDE